MRHPPKNQTFRVRDLAARYGKHPQTIYAWIKSGRLPCARRDPAGGIFFLRRDIEAPERGAPLQEEGTSRPGIPSGRSNPKPQSHTTGRSPASHSISAAREVAPRAGFSGDAPRVAVGSSENPAVKGGKQHEK